jgi:DNA-binding NarL/FixJ family response regulator
MSITQEGIRILIGDDRTMFREGLRNLLDRQPDFRVVGEASAGAEVLDLVVRRDPDVLLLNVAMSGGSGMDALRRLAKDPSRVRTIVFADTAAQAQIVEALTLGARGIVPRRTPAPMLVRSIRAVAAGDYWVGHGDISALIEHVRETEAAPHDSVRSNGHHLTPREIEIITRIVDGYTNKDIASALSISEQTVKHHLTSIFGKVGVSNRLELALFAMQQSYLVTAAEEAYR